MSFHYFFKSGCIPSMDCFHLGLTAIVWQALLEKDQLAAAVVDNAATATSAPVPATVVKKFLRSCFRFMTCPPATRNRIIPHGPHGRRARAALLATVIITGTPLRGAGARCTGTNSGCRIDGPNTFFFTRYNIGVRSVQTDGTNRHKPVVASAVQSGSPVLPATRSEHARAKTSRHQFEGSEPSSAAGT